MTLPSEIDTKFRTAASGAGLLDVAYEVADSPLGPLFLAATERGLCRLAYDADPEAEEERLARGFGARVLRAPRALDEARRELDDYFEGRRHDFDLRIDLAPVGDFHRDVLGRLARVPYGSVTTYGALAAAAGRPRAARAVGTAMNRNPIPIVLPCHRVVGANGSLVGYGGGLDRKERLLQLEGASLTLRG
jgi:methylated-DNA-[protein]-cysteine S-methyltransferase